MSKPLFFVGIALGICILFSIPILIEGSFHYDMNRKKYAFVIRLYRIKIVGGYFTIYPGGIAMHITQKKAILLPYKNMNDERKRFAFIKTFRLIRVHLTVETGANYLMPALIGTAFLRVYLQNKAQFLQTYQSRIWLENGDILRISGNWLLFFNLFIVAKNFIVFLKEKIKILWRKKTEKSTT